MQCGPDETNTNRLSRINLRMARQDEGRENAVYSTGTCKVLADGTAEGVRECVGSRGCGQVIAMRLWGMVAAACHNPSDYTQLADGGCLGTRRQRWGGVE